MSQILEGKVRSNKTHGMVTVEVFRFKKHPLYGKYVKVSKKYKANTEKKIPEGTNIAIESTRPMSKDKKWKVVNI